MQIKQFENTYLSHFSYAILSDCEKKIILIDPARNPQPYIDFAEENEAEITGIIETHPHADFVSSHLEFYNRFGATIYTSKLAAATYPHQAFDDGDQLQSGKIKLTALNTPGHSPDSICIVLEHDGKQKAVFTGDTLFIGDCGRPDLRPGDGDVSEAAIALAKQMYHSLRDKIMVLEDAAIVYPAHGAGTLCGKAVSKANSSTIGEEKKTNWSLQEQPEDEFVNELTSNQPFVPAYFSFDVKLNKKGATAFNQSVKAVKIKNAVTGKNAADGLQESLWTIDTRDAKEYKKGHLKHSINLMPETKFETWLGTLLKPGERFYITAADDKTLQEVIARTAAIGYESQVEEAFIFSHGEVCEEELDIAYFTKHLTGFTIVDVRNKEEVKEKIVFENAIQIPLAELQERVSDIPVNKPVVVHCAGGFRSAAGSSFLQSTLQGSVKVFDLGDAVKNFM